jgi:hypothetical protein
MKVCSIEFTFAWSWGLVITAMIQDLKHIKFERTTMPDRGKQASADVILCQQATLLDKIKEKYKTLCRLGGNRTFDDVDPIKADHYLAQMKECFAIVATNRHLYELAKLANPNSYLIPNGLDVSKWKPREFTVGFAGNVQTARNSQYKGYSLIEEACKLLSVSLKSALYGQKQIPHADMPSKFYHAIDCIVHPTLGEGCSNTLMEACACGVPIITTRQAGYHGELMRDGEECLFCERTVESIADCIRRIRDDRDLRTKLAVNARTFAVQHHDVAIIAKQYEQIFEACAAANSTRPPESPAVPAPYTVQVQAISPLPFLYAGIKRVFGAKFGMSSKDLPSYSTRVKKIA